MQRDDAYEQFRTAQKRYDEANGDFKEAAGIGARLVVDKYRGLFENENVVAQTELRNVLQETQNQLCRVTINYMQAMAEHYRTMKGGYTYFKNVDPELKLIKKNPEVEEKKQIWSSNVSNVKE